jgi:uncharacterized DUF497 family protein
MLPKSFVWDEAKNALLKRKRRISFEEVAASLAERGPLWIDDHPQDDLSQSQSDEDLSRIKRVI